MSSKDEIAAYEMSAVAVPRLLYPLVRPAGSRPVPDAYEAAEAVCAQACAAYETGNYREAGALFVAAANHMNLPAGESYAESFGANRRLMYANAVAALIMVDAIAEARKTLAEIAVADPTCAEAIDRLFADLDASVDAGP